MFENFGSALQEEPEKKDRKENIEERLKNIESLKEHLGEFEELRNTTLFYSPKLPRNEITKTEAPKKEQAILVPTGSGAIVKKDQTIATDHLFGCMAVLILGTENNILAHLTPSDNLPYRSVDLPGHEADNRKFTANLIAHRIDPEHGSLHGCRILLFGNMRELSKNSKFYYKGVEKDWNDLERLFLEAGAESVKQIEMPLDDSLVYYSPEDPDSVHVFGQPVEYSQNTVRNKESTSIQKFSISTHPKDPLPFTISRPAQDEVTRLSIKQKYV